VDRRGARGPVGGVRPLGRRALNGTVGAGTYVAPVALSIEDRQAFLAEPHVAALSVNGEADRGPLTVPIWYGYAPGGELWVHTPAASRKTALIRAAGRFSLLVHRVVPTVRYVSVEGPVTRVTPGTRDDLRAMAGRYLPPEQLDGYVAMAEADHGEAVIIHMRPQRWLSADLG